MEDNERSASEKGRQAKCSAVCAAAAESLASTHMETYVWEAPAGSRGSQCGDEVSAERQNWRSDSALCVMHTLPFVEEMAKVWYKAGMKALLEGMA